MASSCKMFLALTLGLLPVLWALNAAAEPAVLQLWNLGPAAGSIDSSAPSISCATACSVTMTPGDTVILTANPEPGNKFDGWSGDCSGLDSTCALAVDGTRLAVASFKTADDPMTAIHRFLPGPDGSNPRFGRLLAESGYLFGMTSGGGGAGGGTIFRELPDGGQYTIVHQFCGGPSDGSGPSGSLIVYGGVLYGTTEDGGANNKGTIYKISPDGSGFALLHSFAGSPSDGSSPSASLTESGGVLYGTAQGGGASGDGTIFKVNPDGSEFSLLHSFSGEAFDGRSPSGSLLAVDGVLYGMAAGAGSSPSGAGGESHRGTVFKIGPDGSGFALLHSFTGDLADGSEPSGSLLEFGGTLYGLTQGGGVSGTGTIFRVNSDGSEFALLHSFQGPFSDGSSPSGPLTESGGVFYGMTCAGGAHGYGTVFKVNPDGRGFAILHSFTGYGSGGSSPSGSLIASGGVLYGMTDGGDPNAYGTVFRINPDGTGFALLHSFTGYPSDGSEPSGKLLAFGGVLFGMTLQGGVGNGGTVFGINPDGNDYALLHSFTADPSDSSTPSGSLVTSGGVLYGMTSSGGAGGGTIFKLNPDGSDFALLHSFGGYPSDGQSPYGSLVAAGGVLYGMTCYGGANNDGTIFRINPDGTVYAVLHSFTGYPSDGQNPYGSLVEAGGVLYGMTGSGGASGYGTVFKVNVDGGGFAILHAFSDAASDGSTPHGSLLLLDGVLYGMTWEGGAGNYGTVFQIDADGSGFALLHSFLGGPSDGSNTLGSLVGSGGVLYGMTFWGTADPFGTIFKVNLDGSGYAVLHSLTQGDGGRFPSDSSLTPLGGGFYGSTAGGLFRLDVAEHRVRRHVLREPPTIGPGSVTLQGSHDRSSHRH